LQRKPTTVAAEKVEGENSASGSIGRRARRSTTTNSAVPARNVARHARTVVELQPLTP